LRLFWFIRGVKCCNSSVVFFKPRREKSESRKVRKVSRGKTVPFALDNGNLTRKTTSTQTRDFIYSVDDRLLRVEDGRGGIVARYYYDPFGRRLWKEVDGVRRHFVYSDNGLVGEFDASGNELRT
jgi:YD repeat-containing protein